MASMDEFYTDLLQGVLSDANSRSLSRHQSFFERICATLCEAGELKDYEEAEIKSDKFGEIYGYDYEEEREILTLFTLYFSENDTIQALDLREIESKFKRAKKFFEKCHEPIYEQLEEGFNHHNMAYNIYQKLQNHKIKKVRILFLSNAKATKNFTEFKSENINDIELEFRLFDIEHLYKIYLFQSGDEDLDFEIPLKIKALKIENNDEYSSYLALLDAPSLVKFYDKYGTKLLEKNIRTFLQFRTKINKGIKNTITYEPQRFFAYNNGITAVAKEVVMEGNFITKIKNLQIVNGGQTISSIYASAKNFNADISQICVQMKLSVVKGEEQDEFIGKISEYANTQNNVKKSDFFSNSPFHKEFKACSKRIWTPQIRSQKLTHWFYERVRGEYLNEQAYLGEYEKQNFKNDNPKSQMFDKTFLAKCEVVWSQKPYIAIKGAQQSFAEFAKDIIAKMDKNKFLVDDLYFKESIAKIIIYKATEKAIAQDFEADRAYVVAYSISYLSHLAKGLNLGLIWEEQDVPKELLQIIKQIAQNVYEVLKNPPQKMTNLVQWWRMQDCWEKVKNSHFDIEISEDLLLNESQIKGNKQESKKLKKLDNEIEIQSFVIKEDKAKWQNLLKYCENERSFSFTQMDILRKFTLGKLSLPSPKQSKILYDLYEKALDEGVVL